MEEASFLPDEEQESAEAGGGTGGGTQTRKESPLSRVETLRIQLKEAVEREEYEKAAKLRDELRKLEQRH